VKPMQLNPLERQYKLGTDVTEYLLSQMDNRGVIFDVVDDAPTPNDHYAQTFLAWASLNLTRYKEAELALSAFFEQPQGWWGHADFNSFALANICIHPQFSALSKQIKVKVEDYLKNPLFKSAPGASVSNNWLAMQSATLALLGQVRRRQDWQEKAKKTIINYVLNWQLPDGLFVDSPIKPRTSKFATPLTYHVKICSMLIRYALLQNDQPAMTSALRGMKAFCGITFTNGSAFQLGRTNMGLFGYACALDALGNLLERSLGDFALFVETHQALIAQLERMQEPNGYIALNPAGDIAQRPSWDEYMHLTVYNAYFAALATIRRVAWQKRAYNKRVERLTISLLPSSGLVYAYSEETELLLSLSGQAVLGQGHLFCDNRYAGMNICHLTYKANTVIPPPPLDIESPNGPFKSTLLGFHPWFIHKKIDYQFKFFKVVELCIGKNNDFLLTQGSSQPTSIRAIEWEKKLIYERLLLKLKRIILRQRKLEVAKLQLTNPILQRVIFVRLRPFLVLFIDRLCSIKGINSLHSPVVAFQTSPWEKMDNGISFVDADFASWEFLFIPGVKSEPVTVDSWSSSGKTTILSYPAHFPQNELWQCTLLSSTEDRPVDYAFNAVDSHFKLDLKWEKKKLTIAGIIGDKGAISVEEKDS